ncbi:MAG: hypothetical protein IRZ07_00575 [Microbispora sp.]|nr:hypothetical protein [Microbispora sp.]
MIGELTRFAYLRSCTLGMLRFGELELATIERPWIPNPAGPGGRPRESCIPDGMYTVRPHASQRFPNTYALINHALGVYYQPGDVPPGQPWGRTAILIHVGNSVQDVIGCIAVGMHHAAEQLMVVDSRIAMDRLRNVLGRDTHQLIIRPVAGTQEKA